MSYALTIEYGDDVLLSTGLSRGEFDDEATFLLAAKLYELGRLSSGQAASCAPRRASISFSPCPGSESRSRTSAPKTPSPN